MQDSVSSCYRNLHTDQLSHFGLSTEYSMITLKQAAILLIITKIFLPGMILVLNLLMPS